MDVGVEVELSGHRSGRGAGMVAVRAWSGAEVEIK
jgi:hypothetical protein